MITDKNYSIFVTQFEWAIQLPHPNSLYVNDPNMILASWLRNIVNAISLLTEPTFKYLFKTEALCSTTVKL